MTKYSSMTVTENTNHGERLHCWFPTIWQHTTHT